MLGSESIYRKKVSLGGVRPAHKSPDPEVIFEVGAGAGSGQGYLAQVLSFQYNHPVVAIDSCSRHGKVTETRAQQIRKHCAAQIRKLGNWDISIPRTITCRVLSTDMLKALAAIVPPADDVKEPQFIKEDTDGKPSLVLAGLHACGDLSVTMLKVQTAERWSCLDKDAGLQNFDLHAFSVVFRMVLLKYYPGIITSSPSVGRQGKPCAASSRGRSPIPLKMLKAVKSLSAVPREG
ncbi:unnamed protein product [Linum tenue]|uniref:Methyltransferase domain-containing protein n=1 Tax=Linum tenue TaxID=586396 RepID=A0AAV0JHU6_9ROSI|nr:unnamed protein product [Linum tenue]